MIMMIQEKFRNLIVLKKFALKYFNFIFYIFLKKKQISELANKKFVIYYLQKKPEANTDVKGIYIIVII